MKMSIGFWYCIILLTITVREFQIGVTPLKVLAQPVLSEGTRTNQRRTETIAQKITVLVATENSQYSRSRIFFNGSATLVAREGLTYYLLASEPQVTLGNHYLIVIPSLVSSLPNQEIYRATVVYRSNDTDIAVIKFTDVHGILAKSNLARIRYSSKARIGETVYVAGWTDSWKASSFSIEVGKISNVRTLEQKQRLQYSVATKAGMAGGAILDVEGNLLGIHRGRTNELGEGIPISTIDTIRKFGTAAEVIRFLNRFEESKKPL